MRTCRTHNVTGIATYGDCPQCIKESSTPTPKDECEYKEAQDFPRSAFVVPQEQFRNSSEYMTKLLQNCEEHLAKATAALKAIFDATDPYADGAPDATAHDKLCNEISSLARPWARTHSENT